MLNENFPGTDVMIFKIFSPKNLANILTFFAQTTASFWKKDHNIGFWEKRHFFRRKSQKSPKIMIITSTPDCEKRPLLDRVEAEAVQKRPRQVPLVHLQVLPLVSSSESIDLVGNPGDQMIFWKNRPKWGPIHFKLNPFFVKINTWRLPCKKVAQQFGILLYFFVKIYALLHCKALRNLPTFLIGKNIWQPW
jgi:hypothetical protein